MLSRKTESAFTTVGFQNWKKATERFKEHEKSDGHREAMTRLLSQQNQEVSVLLMLSDKQRKDQERHQLMLLRQLSSLRMLLCRGLAIRGHNEEDGNLLQLLKLRIEDCDDLKRWVEEKDYLSPSILNEQISLMGNTLLWQILKNIHESKYFAVLADEVRDIGNKGQLCLLIRWVDSALEMHEDFIGLMEVPSTHANVINAALKDALIRCSLPLSLCRGQAYDGASNMSGHLNGVAAQISREQPLALHVHCLAHSLNLILQDLTRQCPAIRDALDICKTISQLINWSPKQMHRFKIYQHEFAMSDAGNIRPLCPTRLTVRTGAINAVLKNYTGLASTMEEVNTNQHDEYGQKAGGVLAQMEKFSTYFGLKLSHTIFSATEQVSICIQAKDTTVEDVMKAKDMAKHHLHRQRREEAFDRFNSNVTTAAAEHK